MMTQDDFKIMLVNHTPAQLKDLKYRVRILNVELRALPAPAGLSPVHLVKVELFDPKGKVVSDNFYWKETTQDDLTALNTIPDVELVGIGFTAETPRSQRGENGWKRWGL